MNELESIEAEVVGCFKCPRLVAWRESVAENPPRRYAGCDYWAKPVPAFGDDNARIVIVGLAPGAHGSNRTGRMFTGDNSGVFLFASLHRCGLANQSQSSTRNDGLQLNGCLITAAARCAPPNNKPLPEELRNCRPYLLRELRALTQLRVLVGLGKIGFDAAFDAAREVGLTNLKVRPRFAHGAEAQLSETLTLLGTFHPSQQNTFTGRLTAPMMDEVFRRAKQLANEPAA
jgi:uracil-DNA glycosylase family 4